MSEDDKIEVEMNEAAAEDEAETKSSWPEPRLVTLDEFNAIDFQAPIADLKKVECHNLETVYHRLSNETVGKDPSFEVWRILTGVCGLHFRVKDPGDTYGPQMVMGARRSFIPADWIGEQNEVFNALYKEITHPGLRARFADVVWVNDRRKGAAARDAIEAYCDAVEGLRDGRFEERFDYKTTVSNEELDLIERAIQISTVISKRGAALPNRIVSNLMALYEAARDNLDVFPFERVARLCYRFDLLSDDQIARDAEALAIAAANGPDPYPLGIKEIWDLAAAAHRHQDRPEDERRCTLEGIEQTIKMGDHVGQASAQAHWLRTAISELRRVSGTDDYREQLRLQMRQLQEKAMDELSSFSIPVDFTDQITGTLEAFDGLTLPDALKQFATLTVPLSPDALRQQALDSLDHNSIASIFAAVQHDADGKIVGEVGGAPIGGVPDDDWIKNKITELENFRRMEIVNGFIQPSRHYIASSFPIAERHFHSIAINSPFVPPSHAGIFALGFARFFQGDYVAAAHMLVPQVENSIRYVLRNSNTDTSRILNDMLQEDRSLSSLLESYRPELNKAFTPGVVLQIDLMFNGHPGPGLRHEMAHGKIGTGACFHHDMVYAMWFIFQLTCIPLLTYWKQHVGPAIEAAAY